MLKGITVLLYERTRTGVDAFNRPVYEEIPTPVENVLVTPASSEAVVSDLQLLGKKLEYVLCIPKGDTHNWEDVTVEFGGSRYRTYGFPEEWIESMVPLAWNRKVKVERYG